MLGRDEKRCLLSTEKNAALYIDHAALFYLVNVDHYTFLLVKVDQPALFYWSMSTTALFLIDVDQTAVFYWSTVDAVDVHLTAFLITPLCSMLSSINITVLACAKDLYK